MKLTTLACSTVVALASVAAAFPGVAAAAAADAVARREASPGPFWRFCHFRGQGCSKKAKRDETLVDDDSSTDGFALETDDSSFEVVYYADDSDLRELTKRSPDPYNFRYVFCHLRGQGCSKKIKRAVESTDENNDDVVYLTFDNLVDGDPTHDMIRRATEAETDRFNFVFCHLAGQGCSKKVKRAVESLDGEPVE